MCMKPYKMEMFSIKHPHGVHFFFFFCWLCISDFLCTVSASWVLVPGQCPGMVTLRLHSGSAPAVQGPRSKGPCSRSLDRARGGCQRTCGLTLFSIACSWFGENNKMSDYFHRKPHDHVKVTSIP